MLSDAELGELAAKLDAARGEQHSELVRELRARDDEFAVDLAGLYTRCKRGEARTACVYFAIAYARVSQAAFELGLAATRDRATLVRYRACGLLAYSLRREAIFALTPLLGHADARTVADATAAIDAIRNQNHHYFIDRTHSNRTFWTVEPGHATAPR